MTKRIKQSIALTFCTLMLLASGPVCAMIGVDFSGALDVIEASAVSDTYEDDQGVVYELKNVDGENVATVLQYTQTAENIVLLSSVTADGVDYAVTSIASEAFNNCVNVTSIEIPNSIKSIGEGAFKACDSITTVNYLGTEAQWNEIEIATDNTVLTSAKINFIVEDPCQQGHTYGEWTVAKKATCTQKGEKVRCCEVCGEKETQEIAALGHTFGNWVVTKKPTTTAEGVETRTCSACGTKETRAIKKLVPIKVSTPKITTYLKHVSAVRLYWNKAENATGYRVYMKVGSSWKILSNVSNATSYYIGGLKPNTSYAFCIRAYAKNTDGTYSWSSLTPTYTAKTTATTTVLKKTTVGYANVKLNWAKTTGATGYVVKQKVNNTWKTIKVLSSAYDYYYVSNLKQGTNYGFYVTAYVKDSSGKISYLPGDIDVVTTMSAQVQVKSAYANTTNAIKIYWDKIPVASGYRVYCYYNGKCISAQNVTTTSYYKGNLKIGSKYDFIVRAYTYNKNKTVTWHAMSKTKATMTDLSKSTITSSTRNAKAVHIYWTKTPNATGYRVYKKVTGGSWVIVKNLYGSNITSYSVGNLNPSTVYQFAVLPFATGTSQVVWGSLSNTYSAKTFALGWNIINGKRYYFDKKDGTLTTNKVVEMYSLNSNGVATKMPADKNNIKYYYEEILDKYGHTLYGASNAVASNMRYKYMAQKASSVDNAIYAINYRNGACYQYAGFAYELYNYMGYEAKVITGLSGRGREHSWVAVKLNGTWVYYDVLNSRYYYTKSQLLYKGYKWDDSFTRK